MLRIDKRKKKYGEFSPGQPWLSEKPCGFRTDVWASGAVWLGFFEEDPEQASMLVINTCGFIQSAVEEAIEEILGLALLKQNDPDKLLVVTGCMVQRYREELIHELPEVDLFIGTDGCHQIVELVAALMEGELKDKVVIAERFLMDSSMPRRISTPFYRSWLKITEGCNNRCSYCMIPSIRGDLRSRPIADLVNEAASLEQKGVRELSLL